jgi:prepilin-type N-terminal cleavage/methylation domain-containing protein
MKRKHKPRGAFTLVELLVVIAIIGVLIGMTLPALMASREIGRRNLCQANLAQILLALQSYENAYETLPSGVVNPDGPIQNEAAGLHQGWLIQMLPYLDEQVAFDRVDKIKSVYDAANAPVREYWPRAFICPSEPIDLQGASNYAGCHHDFEAPIAADNDGVLFLNSRVRREDITDGLAHTLFVSEKRTAAGDLGWMSGTSATLRNTGLAPNGSPAAPASAPKQGDAQDDPGKSPTYVGGFASGHPAGVHAGFGDGSVEFIADTIDLALWRRLGNRADGQLAPRRPATD